MPALGSLNVIHNKLHALKSCGSNKSNSRTLSVLMSLAGNMFLMSQ